MVNFTVIIGGTEQYVIPNTLQISGRLETRRMCRFELIDNPIGTLSLSIGQEVIITNNSVRIFAGTIDSISSFFESGKYIRHYIVYCVDYAQLCDRHLVAYSYETNYSTITNIFIPTDASTNAALQSGYGVENIYDEDLDTYWVSLGDTYPVWMYIDLGGTETVGGIRLYQPSPVAVPLDFDIQVSDDSLNWETVKSCHFQLAWWNKTPDYTDITFSPVDTRYVRVVSYRGGSATLWAITEFYALETGAPYTAGEIITDIVERFFVDGVVTEGINTDNVATGAEISKATFNYIPASQAFDEICELTGYIWYIDASKNLYFIDSSSNAAPFNLTSVSQNWKDLEIESNRETYRNRQYIRAGTALTELREDTVQAVESDQKILEFPFAVGEVVSIYEGGSEKTFGEYDSSEGRDYYWTYNSPYVRAEVAPGTGVDISLNYRGLFPIMQTERDNTEILSRRALEGGTGIYDAIQDEPNINTQAMGAAKALALLRRYGVIPEVVKFKTFTDGLFEGQLIQMNIPEFDVSGNYLIESVDITDYGTDRLIYTVSTVSGEPLGDWLKWFSKIERQSQKFVLYDDSTVNIVIAASDSVIISDSATESHGAAESRVGYAKAGFCEIL